MAPTCREQTTDQVQDFRSAAPAATHCSVLPLGNTREALGFGLSGNHLGRLCQSAGRRRPLPFLSDASINGCGVGVDSHYLGFIRECLAERIPNLNVFDTVPIWQSRANFLKLMPRAVSTFKASTRIRLESRISQERLKPFDLN